MKLQILIFTVFIAYNSARSDLVYEPYNISNKYLLHSIEDNEAFEQKCLKYLASHRNDLGILSTLAVQYYYMGDTDLSRKIVNRRLARSTGYQARAIADFLQEKFYDLARNSTYKLLVDSAFIDIYDNEANADVIEHLRIIPAIDSIKTFGLCMSGLDEMKEENIIITGQDFEYEIIATENLWHNRKTITIEANQYMYISEEYPVQISYKSLRDATKLALRYNIFDYSYSWSPKVANNTIFRIKIPEGYRLTDQEPIAGKISQYVWRNPELKWFDETLLIDRSGLGISFRMQPPESVYYAFLIDRSPYLLIIFLGILFYIILQQGVIEFTIIDIIVMWGILIAAMVVRFFFRFEIEQLLEKNITPYMSLSPAIQFALPYVYIILIMLMVPLERAKLLFIKKNHKRLTTSKEILNMMEGVTIIEYIALLNIFAHNLQWTIRIINIEFAIANIILFLSIAIIIKRWSILDGSTILEKWMSLLVPLIFIMFINSIDSEIVNIFMIGVVLTSAILLICGHLGSLPVVYKNRRFKKSRFENIILGSAFMEVCTTIYMRFGDEKEKEFISPVITTLVISFLAIAWVMQNTALIVSIVLALIGFQISKPMIKRLFIEFKSTSDD